MNLTLDQWYQVLSDYYGLSRSELERSDAFDFDNPWKVDQEKLNNFYLNKFSSQYGLTPDQLKASGAWDPTDPNWVDTRKLNPYLNKLSPQEAIDRIEQIRANVLIQTGVVNPINVPKLTNTSDPVYAWGPYYNIVVNGVPATYVPKSFVLKGVLTGPYSYQEIKKGGWSDASSGNNKWHYDKLFLQKDTYNWLTPYALSQEEINKITGNGATDQNNYIKSSDIPAFGDGFIIERGKFNELKDKYSSETNWYSGMPRIPSVSGGLTEINGVLHYVGQTADTSGWSQRSDQVIIRPDGSGLYTYAWSKGVQNIPVLNVIDKIARIVYPVYGLAASVIDYAVGTTDSPLGIGLALIGGNIPGADGVAAFQGTFLHLPQIAEFTKNISDFYQTAGLSAEGARIAAQATIAGGLDLLKTGGDFQSAFATAAASVVGQNVASAMGGVFSNIVAKDLTQVLSNVSTAATKAALLRQNVDAAATNAFITSAVPAALNSAVRMTGLADKIPLAALRAINEVATAAALLPNANLEDIIKNAVITTAAKEGLDTIAKAVDVDLSAAGLPKLTTAQKDAIGATINAALSGKSLDQIVNSFNANQFQQESFRQAADQAVQKDGWQNLAERNTAQSFYGKSVTPDQWNRLGQYIDYSTGEDNLANSYKSLFGRSQAYDQFYEFGLDPNEFKRIDTIDDALKAGQSAFISAAIDAYSKGTMSESELRSELRAAGISDSNTSTLVNVAKDSAAKQEKVNTVFKDLLDPGKKLSLEDAAIRLREAGLTETQVSSAIQSITNDFSKAAELRTRTDQIIDDYTAWNSDLSREKALERLVTAGVSATRASELLGLVDTQVESQRYFKEVGREAVQRYAAGDISREDAESALKKGLFPVETVKTMIEYANAIKEGRQLTPGEMEVAAANNLNQWFNVGSGYQVRVARAEDGTIGLVEARDAKGNNITNAFIDPYTQKLMLPTQVPQRVATASNVQVPVSYPEFQRLINPQAIGNLQFDKNTGQYFTVDDNGNRLLALDPSKLPVATPENYHAYLTTWGILKNKGLPLPDPRGYATTTAQQTLPPLLQTVGNALSIPTEAAGRFIGNLGSALETFGVGAQRMTEFGNSLANQAVGMRDEEKQQADLRVIDRFRNATTNAERGRAIFDSVLQDPGAVLRMGGVEVFEELPNIAALAATGGGSALVRLVGMGATQLTDALIESYGGAANEKIQEGLSKGKTRDQSVADAAEDARKAGGITFLANALANKIPFGGTAAKEMLKNAFIEAPEEFLISKALGDDTNTALNKSALALMISPAADAGLRSSGSVVNLVATPQGLQATYADGAKITIGERDGQVTTTYDLPTTNLINNLVTDALASNQRLPTVMNDQLGILSNVNISDFMPTIVSAASNYANAEDITNALITASIENGSFDQSLLTSVINSSLDIPGATNQKVIDSAIGAMLAANQTPQVIANSMFTSGLNSGLSYNTTLNDVTSSLMAKSTDPAATLDQIIPIASQVGLTAGQTPAEVANAVFNTALQAGKTANLNATDTLSNAIDQTYASLIAGGLTPDQASTILGAAASQSGTSNNLTTADVLTSINTGITQAGGNTQLATANVISGQLTGLQTQYNQLSEAQKQIADNLVDQGITLQEAITRAKSELSTEIGEVKTDFQTKYDALTQTQKAQFDALTQSQKDLVTQLATQGTDLATAINTAKTELKTEIGDVKTGLETQIGDIKTQIGNKIDALAKTSADADQVLKGSIDSVAADLGLTREQLLTQLGTTEANLKTEFKTQLDTVQTALQQQIQQQTQQIEKQTAQQKEDARLQRIATGSAAALAIPGLMGQATKQPFIESPSLKSEVTGGIEDPLAKFMKIIQGEPEKAPEVPTPPLGGDMSNYTYGKQPPSYDELFSNQEFAEDPEFMSREELILPYKAGGSPLNIQMMYAKGGEPREDFRHGKHVAGPGDGQSDDIPAWLADGEYVLDAEFVSALGNGSTKAGVALLDELRRQVRAHKRSGPLSSIPPKSKSPLSYLMDAEKVLKKK